MVLDLGALVPTLLDLTFPVRVLLAHGARGSAAGPSPGQQCSGSFTVCS